LRLSQLTAITVENLGIPAQAPPISSLYVNDEDFTPLGQIGRSVRGTIVKGRHIPTGALVTMKRFHKVNEMHYLRGVLIPASFSHPTIVPVFGCTPFSVAQVLILPLMETGSLQSVLDEVGSGKAPDWWTLPAKMIILSGVAAGLAFLYDRHVVHRNLKPTNILLDANHEPKISDFDVSMSEPLDASFRDLWNDHWPEMHDLIYLSPETRERP
jgi:serine/threonine protein kinase